MCLLRRKTRSSFEALEFDDNVQKVAEDETCCDEIDAALLEGQKEVSVMLRISGLEHREERSLG